MAHIKWTQAELDDLQAAQTRWDAEMPEPAPPNPTEPKDAYVHVSEIEKAYDNWLYFHRGIQCEETEARFFTYCHTVEQSFVDDLLDWGSYSFDDQRFGENRHVASSTAQRIKMVAGPHWNTVLNAYYAKHPWK